MLQVIRWRGSNSTNLCFAVFPWDEHVIEALNSRKRFWSNKVGRFWLKITVSFFVLSELPFTFLALVHRRLISYSSQEGRCKCNYFFFSVISSVPDNHCIK